MMSAFEPTTVLIFPPKGAVCVAHGLDLTSFSGQATSPHKEIIVNQICLSVFFFWYAAILLSNLSFSLLAFHQPNMSGI